ncbi:hypothetical protein I4U23_015164 [Adineta vaga]|nr:hypothetical protein I4U23_015164 [Adineta vaga]
MQNVYENSDSIFINNSKQSDDEDAEDFLYKTALLMGQNPKPPTKHQGAKTANSRAKSAFATAMKGIIYPHGVPNKEQYHTVACYRAATEQMACCIANMGSVHLLATDLFECWLRL